MVELLFVVCLQTAPDTCSERSLMFSGVTPQRCAMGAQPELAKWTLTHPGYQIRSWKCQDAALAGRKA